MKKLGIFLILFLILFLLSCLFGQLRALISDVLFLLSNGGDSGVTGEADRPGDLVLSYQVSAKDTLVRSATAAPTTVPVSQTFDVRLDIPATEAESVAGTLVSYEFAVTNTGKNLQDRIIVSASSDLTTLWDWSLLEGGSPSSKVLRDESRRKMSFSRLIKSQQPRAIVKGGPQSFEVDLAPGASESFTLKVKVSHLVQSRPFVNSLSVKNQAGKGANDNWGAGKDSYFLEIRTSSVPGPPATIDTTIEPQTIVADGTSSATIIAIVKDQYGNSVLPTTVAWTLTPSEMGVLSTPFSATINGAATNSLTSIKRKQGSAVISASMARPGEKPIAGSVWRNCRSV